ncbi:long-chain fatty acid--CoA ligase [Curtobacterium sp. MCPF17_011]|uniref:class I adenylate-forming enzyme family protein n=1 Tax=unclassified Curtobacterium TaxID=257496 RepID=UPI000D8574D4|nr:MULTISPECIES: AMP-binding protein [unclassified Curtobacterium]PYY38651.1 long-chain fatty acid--CoA ligase [Curtobacterium sp. MCBD17_030]PZF13454.1 long-chain fatty acid--CoA ligase [Curtobacterium sp. MCPF17_011]
MSADGSDVRRAYDPTRLRAVFERNFTYASAVERNVHRFGGKPALSDPETGRSWTYAQLGAVTGHLVGGLARHGVQAGDVVCYQLMNRPEFAFLYVATQGLRAVGSPMNFRLAPGETAHILDDAEPVVFVYEAAASADVATALALASHRPAVLVSVGEPAPDVEPLPGSITFAELLDTSAPSFRAPEAGTVWDETTRLYTSGTTGRPKAVPLSSLNETLSAHDVIMHLPLSPRDRTLNMSPWFHRGGVYCAGPNPVFYVGAEAVTLRQFDPVRVLDLIEESSLTFVVGAPTNLERLADEQEARPRDLSSLTGIVTMGAPFERQAALRYQRVLTPNISNGYGTTETFWNTFLRGYELTANAGAAGRANIDDDVAVVQALAGRLADPRDQVAKDGKEIGEIAIRSIKSGYAYVHNPDAEQAKFQDGWFYPGDLATWNEDEVVTIVGRKDDMLISGGENVHPVQVEEVLAGHAGVADSIVVGKADPEWGQVVVAYVVRRSGQLTDPTSAASALDAHCRTSTDLADFKRPRLYAFVDELPYTATGKKQHFVMQRRTTDDAEAGLFVRP